MADLSITKPAAAQCQIDAAIRMLFLHGEDFVAIHTVAAAARTILNDLAEARGVGETDNTRFVVEFMYRNNYGLDPTDPAVEAQIKYTVDAIEKDLRTKTLRNRTEIFLNMQTEIQGYPGADEAEARGKELDLDDPRLFGDVPDAEAADNVINLNKDTK
jgi:hypothetical protein